MNLSDIKKDLSEKFEQSFKKDQGGVQIFSGDYEALKQSGFFTHPDYLKIQSFLNESIDIAYRAGETNGKMSGAIERYNQAKEDGTLDKHFPVIGPEDI